MVRKTDHDKVRNMLKDTITLLCKNGLSFRNKFTIEAVIGVTLDDEDVLLVSISEMVKAAMTQESSDGDNSSVEDVGHKRKGHKRKRRKHSQQPNRDSDSEIAFVQNYTNDSETPVGQNGINDSSHIVFPSPSYVVRSSNQKENIRENIDEEVPEHVDENQYTVKEDVQTDAESNDDEDIVFVKQELENNWSQSQSTPSFPDFSDLSRLASSQHPDLSLQSLSNMSSMNVAAPISSHHHSMWQSMSSSQQHQYSAAGGGALVVTPSRLQTAVSSPAHRDPNTSQNTPSQSTPQHFKAARFQCTFCRKSFSEKWYLKTHENTHRGIYPYNCPVCSKGLLTTQHLRLHLKKHQTETGSYLCMKCNNQFHSSEALEEHIIFCATESVFVPQILNVSSEIGDAAESAVSQIFNSKSGSVAEQILNTASETNEDPKPVNKTFETEESPETVLNYIVPQILSTTSENGEPDVARNAGNTETSQNQETMDMDQNETVDDIINVEQASNVNMDDDCDGFADGVGVEDQATGDANE